MFNYSICLEEIMLVTPRILIVEDDRLIAEDLCNQLEELGYEVTGICHSAEEATQRALQEQPDLIIMDILLDGETTGVEARDVIQKGCRIPVVFLTGLSAHQIQNVSVKDPCNYLPKPFTKEELRNCIDDALNHHGLKSA